jgi:hypothetical protein
MTTSQIITASILSLLGILILIGVGDFLIAGYNTASKEEKAKYNVKRIRFLLGGLLIVIGLLSLFLGEPESKLSKWFPLIVVLLTIWVIALANTWAKSNHK